MGGTPLLYISTIVSFVLYETLFCGWCHVLFYSGSFPSLFRRSLFNRETADVTILLY